MKRLLKKAMRDIVVDRRRTLLSMLAILVGIIAFGVILFSYKIISREIVSEYNDINPASATIEVDRVDERLLELTDQFDGIDYYEDQALYSLKVQTYDGEWKTLELHAAGNFSELQLNTITSESGSFDPSEGEVLIERDALSVAGVEIGDTLLISDGNDYSSEFTITGVVADITQHPASMHNVVYAYVSYETLHSMGLQPNIINYNIEGDKYDRDSIVSVSNSYIKMLEENGYSVVELSVSDTPGVSMHYEEYASTLFLLLVFSVVMFLFGCLIMSELISSILSSQIRQIGILKAIGCETKKIMQAFLLAFMILIVFIVVISLPIVVLASAGFSCLTMALSNMKPEDMSVSWYLYLIYCVFALIVPLIIGFFTIRRGIKMSVRDAIVEQGVTEDVHKIKMPQVSFMSRPALLSIRNALRRRSRFIRNAAILSIGGAIFVAVMTSIIATQTTLDNYLNSLGFDYQIMTGTSMTDEVIEEILDANNYITDYEVWGISTAQLIDESNSIGNSYNINASQEDSNMMNPTILEGRWIENSDTNAIVVSHKFMESNPEYSVGSIVKFNIGDTIKEFTLVGVIKDLGETSIYISKQGFDMYIDNSEQFNSLKLKLDFSGERKRNVYSSVESSLQGQGIGILSGESISDISDTISSHYSVTLQTFTFIIFMLIIVSAFGLAATMNAQTSERTKEMGVMKTMGASPKQISRIVTTESIFISLFSWVVSIALGIPLSIAGIHVFGNLIINASLDSNLSSFIIAFLLWLALTFVIGNAASRSAAKRAARLTVSACLRSEY